MVAWSKIMHQNDKNLTNISYKELLPIKSFQILSHVDIDLIVEEEEEEEEEEVPSYS